MALRTTLALSAGHSTRQSLYSPAESNQQAKAIHSKYLYLKPNRLYVCLKQDFTELNNFVTCSSQGPHKYKRQRRNSIADATPK